jgi:hypothetical protein
VSYASNDSALVERFLAIARPRCTMHREFEIELWSDELLPAGTHWQRAISSTIEASDFGLLCVSASFLASRFVTEVELPALTAEQRIVVPFALEPIDIDRINLRGLQALQIFHLRGGGGARRRSFDECRGVQAKHFCDSLVGEIGQRLRRSEMT